MMNFKVVHHQNHARVGAPPQHRLRLAVPGENTFCIRLPKSLGAEILARRDKARSATALVPSTLWLWQRLVLFYPVNVWVGFALQNSCSLIKGLNFGVFERNFFSKFARESLHCIHSLKSSNSRSLCSYLLTTSIMPRGLA